ncbi:MAG TPA: FeoA family protein [Pyrinomonadaceae bacterium]
MRSESARKARSPAQSFDKFSELNKNGPQIMLNEIAIQNLSFTEADEKQTSTLAGLPVGVQARVVAVNGTGSMPRRLMEMGVIPGAPIRVIKSAPLGDPLEVRVRGYHLALRRSEAEMISVISAEA